MDDDRPPRVPPALDAIAAMRAAPRSRLIAGGFGTLVAGVVLFLLMLAAAPSVAPEHIVDRPATAASRSVPSSSRFTR